MLIDTHCHLNSLPFFQQETILLQAKGRFLFIDVSVNYQSAVASVELAQRYECVYSCLGYHPFYVKEFEEKLISLYHQLIGKNKEKIVGIGEVGLDIKQGSLAEQEKIFVEFIKLAQQHNLPLVVHNRLHSSLVLDVLDRYFDSYERIVFHCFCQDKEFLQRVVEKKGSVSFSLNILRRNRNLYSVIKMCPLQHLLCETDSPYMRISGRESTPLDLEKVIFCLAEIKGVSKEELEEIVFNNVQRVFALKVREEYI